MIYTVQPMNARNKEDALTLEILQSIEDNEKVTQRHLADNLGVALGLANSYLKRCARKGFIKIQHVPANRYLYYLTPKGFAEKSRLTAQYLSYSFDFYRKASKSVNESLADCHAKGFRQIIFCGVSELAEIASARLHEYELEHIATYDSHYSDCLFLGKPVWRDLDNQGLHDACLLTVLMHAEKQYVEIINKADKESVFVPGILGLSV